jgi:hypothetical protein
VKGTPSRPLSFAYCTFITCDADQDHIYNLGHILVCFEVISGLKVNLQNLNWF